MTRTMVTLNLGYVSVVTTLRYCIGKVIWGERGRGIDL